MKKLILLSLIIFILNNCTKDYAEGIDWSVSNGNGGRAILKTMAEEDLKNITVNTCKNFGRVLIEFKLESTSSDTSFYSYKCDYSEEMKLKIKQYAEEKKLEGKIPLKIKEELIKQNYERKKELIKQEQEKNNPEYIRKKKLEEKRIAEQNKQQLFENAKIECEAIGYKKGTEKFGECVLDLTE